jgi:hypothetical protein
VGFPQPVEALPIKTVKNAGFSPPENSPPIDQTHLKHSSETSDSSRNIDLPRTLCDNPPRIAVVAAWQSRLSGPFMPTFALAVPADGSMARAVWP